MYPLTKMLQALLKLIKNTEDDEDENSDSDKDENAGVDKDLNDSVSGVFFLGCAHDERSNRFTDRVLFSLAIECHDSVWNPMPYANVPMLEYISATTAKFRKLKLPFPVWTYYESVKTEYQSDKFSTTGRVHSEIVRCFGSNTRCSRLTALAY